MPSSTARRAALSLGALGAALLLDPAPARADFDPATGRVDSRAAAFAYGFDGPPPGRPWVGWALDGSPLDADRLAPRFTGRDAIEGDGAFLIGAPVTALHIDLAGQAPSLVGRRVEVRFWVRAEGTDVEARLWWAGGDPWPGFAGDVFAGPFVAELPFVPSGRATDDGWYELTSGPVDFALGGRLAPDVLSIVDPQRLVADEEVAFGGRVDPDARARLDALEIVDLGPAAVPDAACRLPSQTEDCGDHGVCLFGRCVDGAAAFGPVLPAPLRAAVVRRRAFELSTFDGSRVVAERWPALAARFAGLEAVEEAHRFWTGLRAPYIDSGDGHALGPTPTFNIGASDACTAVGIADRLPGRPTLPLVYHLGASALDGLAVGDAIARIDDMPPDDWLALTRPLLAVQGDPEAFGVDAGRSLLDLAVLTGAAIEVHRCPDPDGCAEGAVEVQRIDLAGISAPIWADGGEQRGNTGLCDYRLERQGLNGNSSVAARDIDGVRVLAINGVPDSRRWRERIAEGLDDGPELLIIDQRVGFGGQSAAVAFMLERLYPDGFESGYASFPATDGWDPDTARDHFEACLAALDEPSVVDCGIAESDRMAGTGAVPAPTRIAVLGGAVVSGNEYLLRMLQARDGVRVFAPAPTIGGFGWVIDVPALVGEATGGRMQLVDTFFAHGDGAFGTGRGVPPDERVVFTQSDLLAGRDTFIEAALEWLRAEEGR